MKRMLGLFIMLTFIGCSESSPPAHSPTSSRTSTEEDARVQVHHTQPFSAVAEEKYREIVAACSALTEDGTFYDKMIAAAESSLRNVDDPAVLRDLTIMVITRQTIRGAYWVCLDRLLELGTDEAARELVYLVTVEECDWDGESGIALDETVTRMGKKALPYLQPLEAKDFVARRQAEAIRRGEVITP